MKKIRLYVASLAVPSLALLCGGAQAATHYIRDGGTASASGTGACTGWAAANACDDLPATLVRGDTYCVADGNYSGRLFNTPNSGGAIITVRKAVNGDGICDRGPNWTASYGDGQAVFAGGLNFSTDYWVIDGVKRNESNWADGPSYGFRTTGIETNYFVWGHASDNVTLKFIDIGPDYGSSNQSGYGALIYLGGFVETADNWVVHRSYLHNGRAIANHAGVHNVTYEYNYIGPNWEKTGIRHQVRGSSVVFRYNIFKNACQGNPLDPTSGSACTAIIGWYGNSGSNNEDYSNSKVYGNLFWDTIGTVFYSDAVIFMGDDRSSQGGGAQNCSNCEIYNNTFVGLGKNNADSKLAFKFEGTRSGTQARNNLWYDFGRAAIGCTAATCSNNYAVTNGAVFVNAGGGNFRLSSDGAAGAGVALSSPYNQDMTGVARGSGTWDAGAFEYSGASAGSSGGTAALAPPQNLTAR